MGVAKSLKSSRIQKVPRKPLKELGLRALVDASDDAIVGTDANGIIVSLEQGRRKDMRVQSGGRFGAVDIDFDTSRSAR